MLAATLATALAAPPVVFAALLVFRALTTPPGVGRHRVSVVGEPYRPRSAAELPGPVVVPGPTDPAATGVLDTRDLVAPVPLARQQAALTGDVTRLMRALIVDIEAAEALDEKTREVARIQ